MPDSARERYELGGHHKLVSRLTIWLVVLAPVLSLGVGALGAAEVYPYKYAMTAGIIALVVPIGLSLLIGAVLGLYILGGWQLAPFGVVFVAGFAALVYGIAADPRPWIDLGVGLLAISGAVFYGTGVMAGMLPTAMLAFLGNGAALVAGAVIATIARLTGNVGWFLFGAMAVGCGAGGLLGLFLVRRRAGSAGGQRPASSSTTGASTSK
ncbi:hypothetical protein EV643_12760 [Kribbella sp. VKM Ac-2527]|uniref:Uncharacterized protein n=1 Tax=Kribbella caucasensis TaxID=2512215 RepID=A0A4R6JI99_9ACTN|nr:hypothetical protein [Kribbella sp. VKM Ac-2527]TDO34366.1 hypothetical protein EV643_12760 [Kribbella sp. VKM Ac-2527]